MIIKSLYLADFSGAKNRTIELSEGFNVIEGENESGKSTVASFIKFMFYGFADKAERTRLYSWGTSSASGTLTLVHGGREYRIEREYTEGAKEKVAIIDLESGAPCHEGQSPADLFLGVPADIFSHTAYIGQAAGGSVDGKAVSRSIENILFSADEAVNTDKSLKKLDDARVLLYHKSRKGGRIYDLMEERNELHVRLENAKQANTGLIAREGSLRETLEGLTEAQTKLAEAQKALDECDAAKHRRSMENLAELATGTANAEKELAEITARAQFHGFMPDREYAAQLASLSARQENIEAQLTAVQSELEAHNMRMADHDAIASFAEKLEELGGDEAVNERLDSADRRRGKMTVLTVVSVIFTLIFGGAAAALYFLDLSPILSALPFTLPAKPLPTLIAAGAAALMFIIAIIAIIVRGHAGMAVNEILADLDVDTRFDLIKKLAQFNFDETRLRLHNSKSQEFTDRIAELKGDRKSLRAEIAAQLELWGRTDIRAAAQEAEEIVEQILSASSERDKFILARDTLAAQLGITDIDAVCRELAEASPIEERSPEVIERIRREYDFYKKQIEALDARRQRLETELAVLEATVEPPTELADRLSALTSNIDTLSNKHRALVLAYNSLAEAANNLRESVSPRLSKTAGELMGDLTDGRYSRIGVGHSLELSYESDSRSHGIEYMSAGTRDIAYLSLRFALIELLYHGELPPMIFDESFSRLDDGRYLRVLELIDKMCNKGSQILLFTSQRRDSRLAAEHLPDSTHISL